MSVGIGVLVLACAVTFYLFAMTTYSSEITYGINGIMTFNPLSVSLIVWIVLRGWHSLPPVIQRHAQIAAIINIPLYLLFGAQGELRGLSMLYISLLLLLAANLELRHRSQSATSDLPQ
jgi:hypothetical protein